MRRTRATTDLPVCVGLGVSNAAQAAEVAAFADGVIVGSAFVKRLLDARRRPAAGLAAVRAPGGELARASASAAGRRWASTGRAAVAVTLTGGIVTPRAKNGA